MHSLYAKSIIRKISVCLICWSASQFLLPSAMAQVLEWVQQIGKAYEGRATKMAMDQDGNVYLTGSFTGTINFPSNGKEIELNSQGGKDAFLAKFNSMGNCFWAFSIGGNGWDVGKDIAISQDGYLYVAGEFGGTFNGESLGVVDFDPSDNTGELMGAGTFDVFIAKYDSSGAFQWVKPVAGPNWEMVNGIAIDQDQNICITGFYQTGTDFEPGDSHMTLPFRGGFMDIFLAQYSSDGDLNWAHGLGSSGDDRGNDVAFDAEGNIYAAGYFSNSIDLDTGPGSQWIVSQGGEDAFFAKYHSNGTLIWGMGIGGIGRDGIEGIDASPDHNVLIAGYFEYTMNYESQEETMELRSNGGSDLFIGQYSSGGENKWLISTGGPSDDVAYNLCALNTGSFLVAGTFQDEVNFGIDSGNSLLRSKGGRNAYVAQYGYHGDLYEVFQLEGDDNNGVGDLLVSADNKNLYCTGSFEGVADFDWSSSELTKDAGVNQDGFLAKYQSSFLKLKPSAHHSEIGVIAKPSLGILQVEVPEGMEGLNLEVYSIDGKLYQSACIERNQPIVDIYVGELEVGTYLLILESKEETLRSVFHWY